MNTNFDLSLLHLTNSYCIRAESNEIEHYVVSALPVIRNCRLSRYRYNKQTLQHTSELHNLILFITNLNYLRVLVIQICILRTISIYWKLKFQPIWWNGNFVAILSNKIVYMWHDFFIYESIEIKQTLKIKGTLPKYNTLIHR